MRVSVIDFRDQRRGWLARALSGDGHEVTSLAFVGTNNAPASDLVLLHVGDDQDEVEMDGGGIGHLLNIYGHAGVVVLCYYGGSPVEVAKQCKFTNVAIYPTPVDSVNPDSDFLRTVRAVLAKLPDREALPADWFRSTVTGFDQLLEAKLEVLVAALKGEGPPQNRLDLLRNKFPDAFLNGRLGCDRTPASVARLRKILFNEEPWEQQK
jgi:hypothetical protein